MNKHFRAGLASADQMPEKPNEHTKLVLSLTTMLYD